MPTMPVRLFWFMFLQSRRRRVSFKSKAELSFMHPAHINNFSRVGMCQLHFKENDYKTRKTSREGAVRKRRLLKIHCVPSVFSTVPKLLQKPHPPLRRTQRAAPSVRQDLFKFEADQMAIKMLRSLKVDTINDLKVKLCYYNKPSEFITTYYKNESNNEVLCYPAI